MTRSNKGERNTGYEFDLLDREKAERDENGVMKHFLAQMGNYDTRAEAVRMKAILERRFDLDYEVRAFESMYEERDEPVVCGWCGFENWYSPFVRYHFLECDDSPFCCEECKLRWLYANDREALEARKEAGSA